MKKRLPFLLIIFIIMTACLTPQLQAVTSTPIATQPPAIVTSLPEQPDALTVCLGQEPNTLYPFGELNASARSVLAAIYDGPFDTIGYEIQPVILSQIPSLEKQKANLTFLRCF